MENDIELENSIFDITDSKPFWQDSPDDFEHYL